MKYETVLFDLDGTLINTNELIIQTFLHTLGHHFPGKYGREDIIPYMGQTLIEQMERYGGADRVDELVAHYRDWNIKMHDELVTAFVNVTEALEKLDKSGVQMGIVTTKMLNTSMMGLKLFNLDQFMKVVISYESTEEHKPHPAPVLKAMKEINANPETTIMIGDSQYDLQAAQAAGIDCAAVAWSMKGADFLRQFNPTYVLDDMMDLVDIVLGKSQDKE